ncbi:MAG: hypothetical protein AAB870_04975, partial [Patescibacteria group bacterium]
MKKSPIFAKTENGVVQIVIVEEEESLAQTRKMILEQVLSSQLGKTVEVLVFSNGSEMETFLLGYNEKIDLFAIDWNTQLETGWSIYGRLKKYRGCEQVPAIFTSGYWDENDIDALKKQHPE